MRYNVIVSVIPFTLALLVSCKSDIGSGTTLDRSLQASFIQEIDECTADNDYIRDVYAVCLENGALRAQYRVVEGVKEASLTIHDPKTFAGKVLSPVVTVILAEGTEHSDPVASAYRSLWEGMVSMFPDGDCLVPSNLYLPAEKIRALELARQGLCHKVQASDICSAYDCFSRGGSAYAPFSDYGDDVSKRVLCSKETAEAVLQSLDSWTLSGIDVRGAFDILPERYGTKAILTAICTVKGHPVTIYLSVTFNDASASVDWPEIGLSLLDRILNTYCHAGS